MDESTCDLSDKYGDKARILPPLLRHFGGKLRFSGPIATVKCFEDNSRVKEIVSTEGAGRVLLVDGGGSMRYALLGDMVAKEAVAHGWSGIVLYGSVRDSAVLGSLPLGVMALAAVPRRSVKSGEGRVGVSIEISGVRCIPGDLLVADEDGALLIDAATVAEGDPAGRGV